MFKQLLLAISFVFVGAICADDQIVTLPEYWPVEGEQTPVTLLRMMQFFYATQYYLAGYLSSKPYIYPNTETFVTCHTALFRRYAISLEALIFSFLYTNDRLAEFKNGNKFIYFVSLLYPLVMAELAKSSASCRVLRLEIELIIQELIANRAGIKDRARAILEALLGQISGKLGILPDVASLVSQCDDLFLKNANLVLNIEGKMGVLNQAYDEGIPTAWVRLRIDAKNRFDRSLALDVIEFDKLAQSIRDNEFMQRTYLEKLWMIKDQQAQLSDFVVGDQACKNYTYGAYATIEGSLLQKKEEVLLELESLRRDLVERMRDGTYSPDDFSNEPPVYNFLFNARINKYISFKSFVEAWNLAGLPVKTELDLADRKLHDGILAFVSPSFDEARVAI